MAKLGDMDPNEWAEEYVAELNRFEKKAEPEVITKYSPSRLIKKVISVVIQARVSEYVYFVEFLSRFNGFMFMLHGRIMNDPEIQFSTASYLQIL